MPSMNQQGLKTVTLPVVKLATFTAYLLALAKVIPIHSRHVNYKKHMVYLTSLGNTSEDVNSNSVTISMLLYHIFPL